MKKIYCLLAIITVTIAINSCQKFNYSEFKKFKDDYKSDPATIAIGWYKLQTQILLERNSALNGVHFGYIGIGLYEAVRYENQHSVSLSTKLNQMPEMPAKETTKDYNWQVSANAVMAAMVRAFYAGLTPQNMASIDSLENLYNQALSAQTPTSVFDRSQSFGRSIASAIYNWYLTDDFNASNAGYVPPVFAGSWVPTPPGFANGVLPYIGTARTYLVSNMNILSPPPIPYSEETNSAFYKMAKKVYDVSQTLTDDQKNTALYWVDQGNGVGYTPGGHDMVIVTEAIEQCHANLVTAAETFAKAGIAERDGTICCFRSKYKYNLVRPVTYIQKLIDPAWQSFIITPPHPEYPAAHAYVTGSVMQAASLSLGKGVGVTDHAYEFRGWPARPFTTLFAAAEQAGISRLYGGIHYLNSIDEGLVLAKELGDKVGAIKLH